MSLAAGAASVSGKQAGAKPSSGRHNFKLNYAPHFKMFSRLAGGKDPRAELNFIAEQGFTTLEDNTMMRRPPGLQEMIAKEMQKQNVKMGAFCVNLELFNEKTFVTTDAEARDKILSNMKRAVDVAKRVNAKWCNTLLGAYDPGLEWGYQTTNVIDNLKRCAEICERAGLVMVLEPLNPWKNHPGLFLTKIPQAYQICKAVNSPSCKILDDLYHQQITEGNLIPNLDRAWDEIAYFQVGDNPGRNEPTTGEINYKNIFKHLYEKGYKGVIGMEHGASKPGREGEQAIIDAYVYCDNF